MRARVLDRVDIALVPDDGDVDVVQQIGLPELQDRLMGTIETRLGALPGLDDQPVEQAS